MRFMSASSSAACFGARCADSTEHFSSSKFVDLLDVDGAVFKVFVAPRVGVAVLESKSLCGPVPLAQLRCVQRTFFALSDFGVPSCLTSAHPALLHDVAMETAVRSSQLDGATAPRAHAAAHQAELIAFSWDEEACAGSCVASSAAVAAFFAFVAAQRAAPTADSSLRGTVAPCEAAQIVGREGAVQAFDVVVIP